MKGTAKERRNNDMITASVFIVFNFVIHFFSEKTLKTVNRITAHKHIFLFLYKALHSILPL